MTHLLLVRSLLLTITVLASPWLNAKTGYLYPAFEVNLDETEWTFDQETPSYLQVAGYFKSARPKFTHNASQITFEINVHIIPDTISLRAMDTLRDERFKKVYKNLYHSYNGEYMQSTYYMVFEPRYYLILQCNKSMTTAENEPIIKSFVDAFTCIGSSKLDEIAGYPLSAQADSDSLFQIRKRACERNNSAVKNREIYIDHLLLLDKQNNFSFARWEEQISIDQNMLYSEEDLALADAQLRVPKNVLWLQPFMPDHYFNVRADSYKSLRRYIHHTKPKEDYSVNRMTHRQCKKGVSYIIASEDTVRLFNIHLRADGTTTSYNSYIYREVPEASNPTMTTPLMAGSKPNELAWTINELTPMADLYLVELKNKIKEPDYVRQTFSTTQLHSVRHPLSAPITFAQPPKLPLCDLHVEYHLNEHHIEQNSFIIYGQAKNYYGTHLPIGSPYPQVNIAKTKQQNFKHPLLKSPLLVSDFDEDQKPEFTICYVAQGAIMQSETYEMTDTTFEVVLPEKIRSYLYQRVEIFELCRQSFKYQEGGTFQYYNELGYDDGYPILVEEVDSYEGMDMMTAEEAIPSVEGPWEYERPSKIYATYECDQPAIFVGGDKAMKKFIDEQMKMPNAPLSSDLVVYVTCHILSNGAVQVQGAMNDNGKVDEYTAEAKRLAAVMPHWTPATKNGQTVTMEKLIVIPFKK